jgi:hypothetical protein
VTGRGERRCDRFQFGNHRFEPRRLHELQVTQGPRH